MLEFFLDFLSSTDIFQYNFFRKFLTEIPFECQTVRTQIRPDIIGPDLGTNFLHLDKQQMTKNMSLADC